MKKTREREEAVRLRGAGWSIKAIAKELKVSTASVSSWVHDVQLTPEQQAILDKRWGSKNEFDYVSWNPRLEDVALALCWAEGCKDRKMVDVTNADPAVIQLFSSFLLRTCNATQSRLKGRLQIHNEKLLEAALVYWSALSCVPKEVIRWEILPVKANSRKKNKHLYGIFSLEYNSVGLKEIVNQKIAELRKLT